MSPIVCDPAKRRTHRNSVLAELREMQLLAMDLMRSGEAKPAEVAQLMRAHVAAEQQRNILRMRPAPKPIDVSDKRRGKRSRAQAAPIAPLPAQPTSPG